MSRVFFLNRFYAPDHSATAQILSDLCEHLATEGYAVEVLTSRLLYDDPKSLLPTIDIINGVFVRRVLTSRFGRSSLHGRLVDYASFYVFASMELLRRVRSGDVVVAKTDPPLIGVFAAIICRLRGARLVNWLQDLYPEVAVSFGMMALRGPVGGVMRAARNLSLKTAYLNVTISEGMAGRVANEGVASSKVAVIHNWADDEAIGVLPFGGGALRTAWGFAREEFVVCYSGNLGRAHDVETMLGAARLLREDPWVRFLFIGGGFHNRVLASRASAESLSSIHFRPYQPRERLAESLAVADAHWLSLKPAFDGLIFPSKFYGIAAAGRPVLAVSGLESELARLVEGQGYGSAVDIGDSAGFAAIIKSWATDPATARRAGDRARTLLEATYTRAASLRRWSKLFSDSRLQLDRSFSDEGRLSSGPHSQEVLRPVTANEGDCIE